MAEIITPAEYVGTLMQLCQDRRGTYLTQEYLTTDRVNLKYELPLAEIVFDFYDKLKSLSRGYASFDYEFIEERTSTAAVFVTVFEAATTTASAGLAAPRAKSSAGTAPPGSAPTTTV